VSDAGVATNGAPAAPAQPSGATVRLRAGLVKLIVLMIVLGFQINILENSPVKVTYDIIIAALILVLLLNHLTTRFAACLIVFALVGVVTRDPVKWFYLALVFYFGFIFIARYGARVGPFVGKLVVLNLVIVMIQLLGITQFVYLFQNYYAPENFVNLLANFGRYDYLPLMQVRPSGVFPSTIYLSLFQFFVVTFLFLYKTPISKRLNFLLALFFAVTGSTTCVLLAFGVVMLAENRAAARQFFKYFIVCVILYWALLPPVFFDWNYSWFSVISSVDSRLFLDVESGGNIHSAFLKEPVLFAFLVVAVTLYLRYAWNINIRRLVFVCTLTFGPLMLHDTLTSVFYWFDAGCIFGILASARWRSPAVQKRVFFSQGVPAVAT
jgi:hypothetical protein